MAVTTIEPDRGDVGLRVDRVLRRHLAHLGGASRNRLQHLIDQGAVRINGTAVTRSSRRVMAGDSIAVDLTVDEADANEFDALQLPGSVMNPDKLRMNEKAVSFVRSFFEAGKPVGSICHAPWTLIEAGVVEGRTLTSYGSIKTDLENAGAKWIDQEVVTDNGLVTSRNPGDLPAFNEKIVEEFAEGFHRQQKAATH